MTGAAPLHWSRRRERSHVWVLRLMTGFSLRAGRRLGRVVLHAIVAYFLLFAPSARRASRAYLERVLPRRVGVRDLYRHLLWFATTIHDRVFLLQGGGRGLQVEVVGAPALLQALAGGRGALLVGAHLGSFEVLRVLGQQRAGLRVAMAMYEDNARKLQTTLQAINPGLGEDIIALGRLESMLAVRDRLDAGGVVGLLADRTLDAGAQQALPFLGAPAHFPLGPWRLAALLRRPVFFMAGLYLGGNRYQLRFEPLADFSALARAERAAAQDAALRRYVATLEATVRAQPWNWFNFYDFWERP